MNPIDAQVQAGGKDLLRVVLSDPATGLPYSAASPGTGAVTIADGADATLGSQADATASSDGGNFSVIALFKRLLAKLSAGIGVSLLTLISGEDQARGWMRTVNGASQSYIFTPLPSAVAGGSVASANNVVGTVGAAGDFLAVLEVKVMSALNSAVFLDQGSLAPVLGGTSGTNPDGTATTALVASAAFSATANQYNGNVAMITYTPTGSAASVTVPRRIVTHPVVSASTGITLTFSHPLPAGSAITSWSIMDPRACREVVPFNTLPGIYSIAFGEASVYGKWKVSVDSSVQARFIGWAT